MTRRKLPAYTQLPRDQRLRTTTQVKVARWPLTPRSEGLPIRRLATRQLHIRVEKTPQPATLLTLIARIGVSSPPTAAVVAPPACRLQGAPPVARCQPQAVLVIVLGRIEQMVGKPYLMGHTQPSTANTGGNHQASSTPLASSTSRPISSPTCCADDA